MGVSDNRFKAGYCQLCGTPANDYLILSSSDENSIIPCPHCGNWIDSTSISDLVEITE